MPDGISAAEIGGKTYLLTVNEGDSRADWDGLDDSKAYVFGGRSFSIFEVTDDGLTLVFDSGSDFEEIIAEQLPDYFNASNDKTALDNRSGKALLLAACEVSGTLAVYELDAGEPDPAPTEPDQVTP